MSVILQRVQANRAAERAKAMARYVELLEKGETATEAAELQKLAATLGKSDAELVADQRLVEELARNEAAVRVGNAAAVSEARAKAKADHDAYAAETERIMAERAGKLKALFLVFGTLDLDFRRASAAEDRAMELIRQNSGLFVGRRSVRFETSPE